MAMHVIAVHGLGIPQDARSAFDILAAERLIERPLADRMKAMVGFRNIAVHDDQQLQIVILQKVIEDRLEDLKTHGSLLLDVCEDQGSRFSNCSKHDDSAAADSQPAKTAGCLGHAVEHRQASSWHARSNSTRSTPAKFAKREGRLVGRTGHPVNPKWARLLRDGIGSVVLFLAVEHFVPACFMMSTLLIG